MSQNDHTASHPNSYDYIVVGGGTAGLTLASRLHKLLNATTILVIEAGGDPSGSDAHPDYKNVRQFKDMHKLGLSNVTSWGFTCDNGPGLNNRVAQATAGKGLGGSALVNAGMWMRGPKTDWDHWARVVDDEDWSYDNMLEFFRCSEDLERSDHDKDATDTTQHGYDGYLKVRPTSVTDKKFPLRDSIIKMWDEVGVKYIPDMNSGQQNGACDAIDIWKKGGGRQLPGEFHNLGGIVIWTNTQVGRVILDKQQQGPVATGIELADGRRVVANKEVIISAGSYQSPKLLQLSGIGDQGLLHEFGIETVVNNTEVGANLADHLITSLIWKLREPEKGLAMGSPKCTDVFWIEGFPQDIVHYDHIPTEGEGKLASLLRNETEREYVLRPDTSHVQNWMVYMPLPSVLTGIDVPVDGNYISTFTCLLTPTSRGRVAIKSRNLSDQPNIEQNYQDTDADRFMMQTGLRRLSHVIRNTEAGRSIIEKEAAPEGHLPIDSDTPDEEIAARVAKYAYSICHPMGTCAMSKVVDTHCRVLGVDRLRVVDASVIPSPPAATIQATVYAVAERVARFIAEGN